MINSSNTCTAINLNTKQLKLTLLLTLTIEPRLDAAIQWKTSFPEWLVWFVCLFVCFSGSVNWTVIYPIEIIFHPLNNWAQLQTSLSATLAFSPQSGLSTQQTGPQSHQMTCFECGLARYRYPHPVEQQDIIVISNFKPRANNYTMICNNLHVQKTILQLCAQLLACECKRGWR